MQEMSQTDDDSSFADGCGTGLHIYIQIIGLYQ